MLPDGVTSAHVELYDKMVQLLLRQNMPDVANRYANRILHIATWNESKKEGKFYEYEINPASGALLGEPKVYTVPGKVKSMCWKYAMER